MVTFVGCYYNEFMPSLESQWNSATFQIFLLPNCPLYLNSANQSLKYENLISSEQLLLPESQVWGWKQTGRLGKSVGGIGKSVPCHPNPELKQSLCNCLHDQIPRLPQEPNGVFALCLKTRVESVQSKEPSGQRCLHSSAS